MPGYEASGSFGFGAPRTTPAEIVDKLNREINAVLADPKAKARIAELGGEPLAGRLPPTAGCWPKPKSGAGGARRQHQGGVGRPAADIARNPSGERARPSRLAPSRTCRSIRDISVTRERTSSAIGMSAARPGPQKSAYVEAICWRDLSPVCQASAEGQSVNIETGGTDMLTVVT